MRVGGTPPAHLTYCSNIHPGESWDEIFANLRRYVPGVKARVAANTEFGVGLRLSADAAATLSDASRLDELREFLRHNGLYVFTINGFPYGRFHQTRVKEDVYRPDWREDARVDYTDTLADILAALLPVDTAVNGTVSTVPGAFKQEMRSTEDVDRIATRMIRHAAHLVRLHAATGRMISLAIEPEPECFLETIDDAVTFFERHLYSDNAAVELQRLTGLNASDAADALRDHLGLCLDLCHAAVEFEDIASCVERLAAAGIRVGKAQLSAGLRIDPMTARAAEELRTFDDGVYLHQVVARSGDRLTRYVDLDVALANPPPNGAACEWRVHFHVPLFLADLESFSTTQSFLADALALHKTRSLSTHLEVETYTWDVLPEQYRRDDIITAISRELEWVKRQLAA